MRSTVKVCCMQQTCGVTLPLWWHATKRAAVTIQSQPKWAYPNCWIAYQTLCVCVCVCGERHASSTLLSLSLSLRFFNWKLNCARAELVLIKGECIKHFVARLQNELLQKARDNTIPRNGMPLKLQLYICLELFNPVEIVQV